MVAKQLSTNSILISIYKIYLVMPAPPQFPDGGVIGLNAVCCHVKENEICLVLDTLVVDTA